MSNQERDSLVFRLEQLEQNQQLLAKYMAEMKRQLDSKSEQFNNQPELQQRTSLQDALNQLHWQFDERSALPAAPVEVVNEPTEESSSTEESQQQPAQVHSSKYQLVFDRFGSRAVLWEALEKAQERLIIVCPWLNRNSIDANLMQKFRDCLNRNCRIDIGWGHLSDRGKLGKGWRYDALRDLRQLERDYPEQFKLKLLGTHEKFLVCDFTFAMLGSHNMLTSSAQSAERELGIHTTDPHVIQGLIDRFDGAEVQDSQAIDQSVTAGSVNLDDVEVLETQDIGEESDAILLNPDNGGTAQDSNDSTEYVRGTAIDAEEFLRRYKAGESDFTGINLAGVNLIGVSLDRGNVNLSKANLTRSNLTRAKLSNINFSGANLSGANLLEAILSYTNLTGADLRNTELSAAQLNNAKLVGTNLNGAGLIQAQLSGADLSEANLNYTNLTAAYLVGANLMKANLKGINLAAAELTGCNLRKAEFNDKTKLSGANLSSVNLAGQELQKINMSGVNMSHANLCGARLCSSNLSGANLTSADLRGADLGGANLEKANMKGAKLSGADLDEAKLSGAVMSDGTVHD